MQSPRPSPHSLDGVRHSASERRNATFPHSPYARVSAAAPTARRSAAHASGFAGAVTFHSAACAWTDAEDVHASHRSMQFGCWGCDVIIQASAQPVTPSRGTTARIGTDLVRRMTTGRPTPATTL